MRVAIMGAGGVGGYFGGRLAAAGHDVWFIARGEHLKEILRRGLRVKSIRGDFSVFPVQATADPAAVGPVQVAIVAVKGWQLPEAAEGMIPLVGPETAVLPLLNGVEAVDGLARVLPRGRILGGFCRIIAYVEAPGRIRHAGIEPTVVFGEPDDRRSPRTESIRSMFAEARIEVEVPPDIAAAIWTKFLLISTWSGIGAVTDASVGVWRGVPGTRAIARASLEESLAVARARGVELGPELVDRIMGVIDSAPADGTASMQRDIAAGRPSELESLSGAVVRLGAEVGVSTPTHSFLYESLSPRETRARSARDR